MIAYGECSHVYIYIHIYMYIYIRNRSGNVTYKNRNEVVQPLDKSKQGEDAVHCLVGTEKTDESEMLQKWKTGLKSP